MNMREWKIGGEISKKFFDTINIKEFFPKDSGVIYVREIMDNMREYYEQHPELIPDELGGCVFSFYNEADFCSYLSSRYGFKSSFDVVEIYSIFVS